MYASIIVFSARFGKIWSSDSLVRCFGFLRAFFGLMVDGATGAMFCYGLGEGGGGREIIKEELAKMV